MAFSITAIATLLKDVFGIHGAIATLPGEIDLNYKVVTKENKKFTLKIANTNEKRKNLEFQNAMMGYLKGQSPDMEIPSIVLSLKSEPITTITDQEGNSRMVRLLTWVEGRPLATVNPHTPGLLLRLGVFCGKLTNALKGFDHSAAQRFIKWDIAQVTWTYPYYEQFNDPKKRQIAQYFYALYQSVVKPLTDTLPKSVIYNDANDYNVLVNHNLPDPDVPGVIDFGDAVFSHTINDLAIALAYALMHKPDPLEAAHNIVKGYSQQVHLSDDECSALFPLIACRLLISTTCSLINLKEEPNNKYLQISDQAAWGLLEKLYAIPPPLAYYCFRDACGREPCPKAVLFRQWARLNGDNLGKITDNNWRDAHSLDLSIGSLELGGWADIADGKKLKQRVHHAITEAGKTIGIGNYGEVRPFYTTAQYEHIGNEGKTWRTVHLGLDLFVGARTTVYTPLDAEVCSAKDNAGSRNYEPTIILKHTVSAELTFYTLYGHLARKSLAGLKPGEKIPKGTAIGTIGSFEENREWPSHLHFQVILDLLDMKNDFPGVALPWQSKIWQSVCPDPWLLMKGEPSPKAVAPAHDSLISYRKNHLGKNLSLSYHRPLQMVRGCGQFLIDDTGRKYLDTVNNVAHVGHEHPRVVAAGQKQMAVLNTNTRYLHRNIIQFTEALLSTMPKQLSVAYLVNSGSEANELALRIAKNYTRQKDVVVLEVGYHGNTNACVDISSYKFDRKGGTGAPSHVHVVPIPDVYRGIYRRGQHAGERYAQHVGQAIEDIKKQGRGISGFIAESVLSCGGQIVLPEGYLKEAYRHVRAAGGVCIADEVQTGCGRAGEYFWAFESQGVVPDIVTIGKPIGNGHPLGVVVTQPVLADAFANGMEYFNTFGGNPVSCAIGLEVLRVIEEEGLQQNASRTGALLKQGLLELSNRYAIIGDVRGLGLFIGIELVKDNNLAPATQEASYLVNRMKTLGILMSTDGPFDNIIKIKPPMVFNDQDVQFLLETLDRVLNEDFMLQGRLQH